MGVGVVTARRRYTATQKASMVGEAEVTGVRPTARRNHVPESTIRHWRDTPAMAQLRAEKREDVASDVWGAFQVGVRRIVELIPQTDDLQKVATATGIVYDKYALMTGLVTNRTETVAVTEGLDDHEKAALRKVIDGVLESVE